MAEQIGACNSERLPPLSMHGLDVMEEGIQAPKLLRYAVMFFAFLSGFNVTSSMIVVVSIQTANIYERSNISIWELCLIPLISGLIGGTLILMFSKKYLKKTGNRYYLALILFIIIACLPLPQPMLYTI